MGVVLIYVHAGGMLFRSRGCFESPSIDDDVGDSGIGGVCLGGDGGVEQADRDGREEGDFFGSEGGSVADRRPR